MRAFPKYKGEVWYWSSIRKVEALNSKSRIIKNFVICLIDRLDVPPTMEVHYYSRIVSRGEMRYNWSLEIFALVIQVYVVTYPTCLRFSLQTQTRTFSYFKAKQQRYLRNLLQIKQTCLQNILSKYLSGWSLYLLNIRDRCDSSAYLGKQINR